MSTYAIGDVQGCYPELLELLNKISFDPRKDVVWFLGDLVNRGPFSLKVIELIRSLGKAAKVVLGNHDLHFLAIYFGGHSLNKNDTFVDLLSSEKVDEIAEWYCSQPLLGVDHQLGYAMVHAGIPHIWDLEQATGFATEVERCLQSEDRGHFFQHMYGNNPNTWAEDLTGMDRLRSITNYFTRMRLIDEMGTLDFSHKGNPTESPEDWIPWYELRREKPLGVKVLFGHWASLTAGTGDPDLIALDTGCVWGRELTAFCLDTDTTYSVQPQSS